MKKVFGYIMIILLFAGSICGVVFGIMWGNLKNETSHILTQTETVKSVNQLNLDDNSSIEL